MRMDDPVILCGMTVGLWIKSDSMGYGVRIIQSGSYIKDCLYDSKRKL